MLARAAAIRRGKTSDTNRFSRVHPGDPAKVTLLRQTYGADMPDARRRQVLADPNNCSQMVIRWGDSYGFLTRYTVSATAAADGGQVVCGSFSDTIGQSFPVTIPVDDFFGFFTSLVKRGDADRLNLVQYAKEPDTIHGPPGAGVRAAPAEPGHDRLHWDELPDGHDPADEPVIVVLPMCLPVGPGQTCEHFALLGAAGTHEAFPELDVGAVRCVIASTTTGTTPSAGAGPSSTYPALPLMTAKTTPLKGLPFAPT